MSLSPALAHPAPATSTAVQPLRADLEAPLQQVEHCLAELAVALRDNDASGIENSAQALQGALSAAVDRFRLAARQGAVPLPMKRRLASASALVATQRESLARATAALDRAIDVLLPAPAPTYGAAGAYARPSGRAGAVA
jgi:hypothetical protein